MSEQDKASQDDLVEEAVSWVIGASQDSWMNGFFLKVMEILQRLQLEVWQRVTTHGESVYHFVSYKF